MTTNQIAYYKAREDARHNRATEKFQSRDLDEKVRHNLVSEVNDWYASASKYESSIYSANKQAETSRYVADTNAATSRYVSDNSREASRYAADKSYAASIYASDTNRLIADMNRQYQERQLAANERIMQFNRENQMKIAQLQAETARYGTNTNKETTLQVTKENNISRLLEEAYESQAQFSMVKYKTDVDATTKVGTSVINGLFSLAPL